MRLCVVGFGLVGASVAAAHRARDSAASVVAVDAPHVLARAAADVKVDRGDARGVERELASADLVVLAAPVSVIEAELPRVLAHASLVTDCGSTKRSIVGAAASAARRGRFVPGHPLAGGSSAGPDAATAELFQGRAWVLCPEGSDADAFAKVEAFVQSLGASPLVMSAEEHDRALALTSHVPQLLASVLIVLAERRRARHAAGPGFASATRVAGGNPEIWRDILATNADEVAAALRELGRELGSAADGLERGDTDAALAIIRAARQHG